MLNNRARKESAFWKAVVFFKKGGGCTYYSSDYNSTRSITDRQIGLVRLMRLVVKIGSKAKAAIIYNNKTGLEKTRYITGKWIENLRK